MQTLSAGAVPALWSRSGECVRNCSDWLLVAKTRPAVVGTELTPAAATVSRLHIACCSPGSGVVTTYLCTLLRDRGLPVPCCLGIDINQKACEVTRRTAAAANLDEHEQEHDAEVKATRQPADAAAGQRSVTNASKGSCAKGMLPSCIGKRVDTLCSDLLSNLLVSGVRACDEM